MIFAVHTVGINSRALKNTAFSAGSQTGRKISVNWRIKWRTSRTKLSGEIVVDKSNSWADDCGGVL